ncbi:hypothetical protein FOPG_20219 [Fusarium oxysporum f. sp. conglutinans race 2 54008]|uniref:Uncharacterized protein n=1 Tax=Fusarium oxysporum f. sp. conglutinans race 2 54008 TaxID=1089457 RepID=X0GIP5_FUSOX|nr:hypothetical protein FOPG_20219 [Fusarium oxysporum f. sp. conglutinans race 2 54008]
MTGSPLAPWIRSALPSSSTEKSLCSSKNTSGQAKNRFSGRSVTIMRRWKRTNAAVYIYMDYSGWPATCSCRR